MVIVVVSCPAATSQRRSVRKLRSEDYHIESAAKTVESLKVVCVECICRFGYSVEEKNVPVLVTQPFLKSVFCLMKELKSKRF